MGDIFSLYCQGCGYGVELRTGVGMLFGSLENVLFLVSKPRREKVKELLRREDLPVSNIVILYLHALSARCRDHDLIIGLNMGKERFINPTSCALTAEPD